MKKWKELLLCPNCERPTEAEVEWPDGYPWPSRCECGKQLIQESEWKTLIKEKDVVRVRLYGDTYGSGVVTGFLDYGE